MDRKRLKQLRFENFDRLMLRYGGSPKEFCEQTAYKDPTVISQLKGRHRAFGADLARQIEEAAGLEKYALENEAGIEAEVKKAAKQPSGWPFDFSLDEYMALSGKVRREINDSMTRQVIGAHTQQLIEKRRKREA